MPAATSWSNEKNAAGADGFVASRWHVEIWQRLVIIFRLQAHCKSGRYIDTDDVFMKIFKDIPEARLGNAASRHQSANDAVRPGQNRAADFVRHRRGGVEGAAGALLAAAAGVYGILAVLGLIGGTLGYGVRSFYGYLRTKEKYQLNLTESLYYQNLDNNAGVLFRLLD